MSSFWNDRRLSYAFLFFRVPACITDTCIMLLLLSNVEHRMMYNTSFRATCDDISSIYQLWTGFCRIIHQDKVHAGLKTVKEQVERVQRPN
jgi:hypothetical protein